MENLSHLRVYRKLHPKIQEALIDFHTSPKNEDIQHKFYANFLSYINIWSTRDIPTFGVNVSIDGMNLYYNPDFVDTLDKGSIYFILIHEIYHLLFNHQSRTIKAGNEQKLSNIVQDWIINELIGYHHNLKYIYPPRDAEGKNIGAFLPKEYDGPLVYEALYIWAKNKRDEIEKNNQNSDKDSNQKQTKKSNQNSGYGKFGKTFDTWSLKDQLSGTEELEVFDVHLEDEVPNEIADEKRAMVVEKIRARGIELGDMKFVLENLNPPPVDNPLKKLRGIISEAISKQSSYKTYRKLSRREEEGFKGKKKVGYTINVLLDTSGSMESEFETVLSYLLNAGATINLVQCDAEVKDFVVIKSQNDVKNLKIKGLGGTVLQPGIDYFVEQGLNNMPIAILTDGYTDTLNLEQFPSSIILYTERECPTVGNYEQVKINTNKSFSYE